MYACGSCHMGAQVLTQHLHQSETHMEICRHARRGGHEGPGAHSVHQQLEVLRCVMHAGDTDTDEGGCHAMACSQGCCRVQGLWVI